MHNVVLLFLLEKQSFRAIINKNNKNEFNFTFICSTVAVIISLFRSKFQSNIILFLSKC